MIALITGGAGFLGHYLVEHILYHTDWDVIILDKLSYAARGFERLRETDILRNERVKVLTHDLAYPMSDGLEKEIGSPDYVFHLAAESHVDASVQDPIEFVQSNVLGTAQLLEWARDKYGIKRFIYFSTDEVFGEAIGEAFGPYARHNPMNPYAASKSAGEQIVTAYNHTYNRVSAIVVHCMNIFGYRQHPEKFIPKAIKRILNGQPVDVYTDRNGTMGSRYYVHAGDVARALVALAELGEPELKWNIRGVKEIDNLSMVNIIANVLERTAEVNLVTFDLGDSSHDLRYDLEGNVDLMVSEEEFDAQLKDTILWTASHRKWLEE